MWEQVRSFDTSKGGSVAGYCLRNVRLGYNIGPVYASAWQAWNGTPQRTGTIPKGVAVPLYYDYTDRNGNRYGHINVQLPDGRIWNDGRFFQSRTSFQNSMSNVRYVGWSTHVNNVQVIKESPVDNINWRHIISVLTRFKGGYTATADQVKKYTGKLQLLSNNLDDGSGKERQTLAEKTKGDFDFWQHLPQAMRPIVRSFVLDLKKRLNKANTEVTKAHKTIASKQTEIDDLEDRVKLATDSHYLVQAELTDAIQESNQLSRTVENIKDEKATLEKQVKDLEKEVKEVVAESAVIGKDTTQLNALGSLLRWFIQRLGLKD